jgi:benzodiazapine receptor
MSSSLRSLFSLAVFVCLALAAGAVGAQFEPGLWYAGLAKPSWTPPNWVFAPVWSLLYILMSIAAWLVWCRVRSVGWPLAVWFFQLVLNAAWSWLFFELHRPGLAFAEIIVLFVAILATTLVFIRVRLSAGLLLLPYAVWVAFASALNLAIWRLNG